MSVPTDRRVLGRRAAARAIAGGLLATLGAPRSLLARAEACADRGVAAPLRIGVLHPVVADAAWREASNGIRLGAEEADRVASLLRREIVVREGSAEELRAHGVDVLVGGVAADDCAALAAAAERAGVAALDLSCGAPLDARGSPRLFHVAPGAETRRLAAARAGAPGALALWHPSLERFGAGQLNARYEARFADAMGSAAWAGWVAVKIAWESFLRLDPARGDALDAFLLSPRARFDGHKGRALFFDPATRELRQPLYIVRSDAGAAPAVEQIDPADPPARRDAAGPETGR